MPKYILSLTKNPNKNSLCLLCATDCPVFEVKTKINVSVPSGVINRPKSIDLNIKRFLLLILVLSVARIDDSTKKSEFKCLDFLVKYANIVHSIMGTEH